MNSQPQSRPPFNQSRPSAKPFVAKGHDAIIKRYQDAKDDVVIVMISGERLLGKIISRDKYTISMRATDPQEDTTPGKEYEVTVYKHAIESFFKSA